MFHTSFGFGFTPTFSHPPLEQQRFRNAPKTSSSLNMGIFDNISKAFSNQDYGSQDQRVRASHILIKGDDVSRVLGKIKVIMGELQDRAMKTEQEDAMSNIEVLLPIFSDLARRESQCPSGSQGGDLGLFGPGKMVKEFDEVIFPKEEDGTTPPTTGALIAPVITDFGCHIILVTERGVNRDQVEEKLARND
jgi:parvulin-like peptidyl-prolyl isomerase